MISEDLCKVDSCYHREEGGSGTQKHKRVYAHNSIPWPKENETKTYQRKNNFNPSSYRILQLLYYAVFLQSLQFGFIHLTEYKYTEIRAFFRLRFA